MKKLLHSLIGKIPSSIFFRASIHSIFNEEFGDITNIPTLESRNDLYEYAFKNTISSESPINFIEFGVWKGESLRFFVSKNKNVKSRFFGLDSFEGIPEKWGPYDVGSWSADGKIPYIDDKRVHFIKGLFQVSWEEAQSLISDNIENEIFVNYDADLYSSTLFALTKMDIFKKSYYAVFDEFFGHESKALSDYLCSYSAKVEFIAKTDDPLGKPFQVLCKITPKTS